MAGLCLGRVVAATPLVEMELDAPGVHVAAWELPSSISAVGVSDWHFVEVELDIPSPPAHRPGL
ncbi:hypothetical protein [Halopseudomonas salina]|uniref:Secreted protein n=1 Tax=Halopseudomonas salina TaxID=1323744 RepID=A0ABQ1PBU6_9GAMM|nr:hypothetical protein [Halopseudomonas salina]GGC94149.1 hypothetical protein GCM10007418_12100 [Halopseudomonas salina]